MYIWYIRVCKHAIQTSQLIYMIVVVPMIVSVYVDRNKLPTVRILNISFMHNISGQQILLETYKHAYIHTYIYIHAVKPPQNASFD